MINTLFSRQFVVAFLLTLLCSLAGSFLGGLPYLSVIGALVIALILGMLMQFAQPAVAYSQPGIGLISNKFLRLGIILLGFKLNLIALAQAGIKTILLPKENKRDYTEIPENVRQNLEFIWVEHLDEVLAQALIKGERGSE